MQNVTKQTPRVGTYDNVKKRTNTQGGTYAQYTKTNEHTGWGHTHNLQKRTNTHNFGTSRALYIDYSILYKKHDIDVVLYMIGIILTENNGNI